MHELVEVGFAETLHFGESPPENVEILQRARHHPALVDVPDETADLGQGLGVLEFDLEASRTRDVLQRTQLLYRFTVAPRRVCTALDHVANFAVRPHEAVRDLVEIVAFTAGIEDLHNPGPVIGVHVADQFLVAHGQQLFHRATVNTRVLPGAGNQPPVLHVPAKTADLRYPLRLGELHLHKPGFGHILHGTELLGDLAVAHGDGDAAFDDGPDLAVVPADTVLEFVFLAGPGEFFVYLFHMLEIFHQDQFLEVLERETH